MVLVRDRYMCRQCGANLSNSSPVDHIIPHRGDYALRMDPGNCQALCETCHNRKTVREDGGFGRG